MALCTCVCVCAASQLSVILIMALGMQVEGAYMQGMGWTCIEELVWGDQQHKWVKPGVLHTRGPGVNKFSLPTCNAACSKQRLRCRWLTRADGVGKL